MRNTSPKMNSSTRSAIASEKTIPAITAIAVITNCIAASSKSAKRFTSKNSRLLPAFSRSCRRLRIRDYDAGIATENSRDLFVALAADLHRVAHIHQRGELHHVSVAQTNAAMRRRLPDRTWSACSVDAVALLAQADPARAQRILFAGRDHHPCVVIGRVSQ